MLIFVSSAPFLSTLMSKDSTVLRFFFARCISDLYENMREYAEFFKKSQICTYSSTAKNMRKICAEVKKYAQNMRKSQEICAKYAQICANIRILGEMANMRKICANMRKYAQRI